MNTLLLIALFTVSFWMGYILGKGSGLQEANKGLERISKSLEK